jgi:hypothetical protein
MMKKAIPLAGMLLALALIASAQKPATTDTVNCRAMEVFVAHKLGTTAVIFHQRDKADGPHLGDLLKAHTGEQVEFETADGRWHGATVERVRSCFGRGLLLFASSEGKLSAKEDFVVRFSAGR